MLAGEDDFEGGKDDLEVNDEDGDDLEKLKLLSLDSTEKNIKSIAQIE